MYVTWPFLACQAKRFYTSITQKMQHFLHHSGQTCVQKQLYSNQLVWSKAMPQLKPRRWNFLSILNFHENTNTVLHDWIRKLHDCAIISWTAGVYWWIISPFWKSWHLSALFCIKKCYWMLQGTETLQGTINMHEFLIKWVQSKL